MGQEYRRRLPHFNADQRPFFVTFNLDGAIPTKRRKERLAQLEFLKQNPELEKPWFAALERSLHRATGPTYLWNPEIAKLVLKTFQEWHAIELHAMTVMPNHVHALFCIPTSDDGMTPTLSKVMHSLKRYTAGKANQILGRSGTFWQHEGFDRVVRDHAEWSRVMNYILENPVKAGLVNDWRDWPWTYSAALS